MTEQESSPVTRRSLPRWTGLVCAGLSALVLAVFSIRAIRSDTVPLLVPHQHCEWILYPSPAIAWANRQIELGTEFRHTIVGHGNTAEINVWALERAVVLLNGTELTPSKVGKNWKQASIYDVAPLLRPGTNQLSITVFSKTSLPALAASIRVDGVQEGTDERWQCSFAGGTWLPAQLASKPFAIRRGNDAYVTDTPLSGFRSHAGLLIAFAILGALLFMLVKLAERFPEAAPNRIYAPDRWPWLFLALLAVGWGALWCNNLKYLPFTIGFDVVGHLNYIDFILREHSLPLADQGFQMYQPPLYYLCGAGLLKFIGATPFDANGMFALRLFGLVCGLATLTFLLLTARLLFPRNPGRQIVALAMGAFMGMNLYLCQYVTNEILNTAVMFAAFYMCLRILVNDKLSWGQHLAAGVLLGAAMLSKQSAIVLVVIGMVTIAANLWVKGSLTGESAVRYLGAPVALALMVCGWHYYRVALHFGNSFTTNLDAASGFNNFWQAPGYRTISSFGFSGQALVAPYFSGFAGVPDLLYSTLWGDGLWGGSVSNQARPPWNYSLMAAGYWLSLVPTFLIIAGVARAIWSFLRKPEPVNMQSLGLIFLTALLLLQMSFKAPAYSAPKAFYASGSVIALCLLAAEGCVWITRRLPGSRAFLLVALTVWGLASCSAFWIQPDASLSQRTKKASQVRCDTNDPEWHFAKASTAAMDTEYDGAIDSAKRALALAPDDSTPTYELVISLSKAGRKSEALLAAREAVRIEPLRWESHALLGDIVASLGRIEEAAAQNALAIKLHVTLR